MARINGTKGDDWIQTWWDEASYWDDNWVTAKGGNDSVTGGGGDDRLNGEKGDDYIYASGGMDWTYGGAGNDTIIDDGFARIAKGGDGNDDITANSGRLEGNAGRDILSIHAVDHGSGTATMSGGTGADVFRISGQFDNDETQVTITDFKRGVDKLALDNDYDIWTTPADPSSEGTAGMFASMDFDGDGMLTAANDMGQSNGPATIWFNATGARIEFSPYFYWGGESVDLPGVWELSKADFML